MINLNSKKWLLICLSSVFLSACDPNFNSPVGDTSSYSAGDADFSNYVAVGDSLTAGYADGALYRLGQESSFPNILATQFKTVGGGVFNQPLMNDNLGGLLFGTAPNPSFANRLVLDAATSPPSPGAIVGTPTNEVFSSPLIGTTFNNTGVPILFDLLPVQRPLLLQMLQTKCLRFLHYGLATMMSYPMQQVAEMELIQPAMA
jgi:hypothetical protein